MKKQDKQVVRTAVQLEQKYELGKNNGTGPDISRLRLELRAMIEKAGDELRKEFDSTIEQCVSEDDLEDFVTNEVFEEHKKECADGVSPAVLVSDIEGGHRITITDANGSKYFDVMNGKDGNDGVDGSDGADGHDGEDGADGRGISSVARTSGNGEAGTTDTYTIAYTDNTTSTFTVYNGKDGETYTLTSADKSSIADEVISRMDLSIGIASDGLIYIFVNGSPVGTGIPQGQSGDVLGYVDENNTVVLSGNLAGGTYTVKYEMEEGDPIYIGELVLDNNVYYSVINTLTNCTNSNGATEAVGGGSYSATITANSGYELKSVAVTMGGTAVSVSGGVINIASVTGDIIITAVAEEAVVEITNWITEVGYTADTRLSLSSGNPTTATDYECTGFIPAKIGDVLRVKNVDLTSENSINIVFYDSSENPIACNGVNNGTTLANFFSTAEENNVYKGTIENTAILTFATDVAYIRIGSKSITADSILTVNEEII